MVDSPPVDSVGVAERVARFSTRSIKTESKLKALKLVLSMMDLTTLEGKDTEDKVRRLCYKAGHLHAEMPELPKVAAVCVYPTFVKVARRELEGSGIAVASVATAYAPFEKEPRKCFESDKRHSTTGETCSRKAKKLN